MSLGICEAKNHLAPVPHGRRMLSSNRENPTWVGSQRSGKSADIPWSPLPSTPLNYQLASRAQESFARDKPSASRGIPACVTPALWQLPDSHLSNSSTSLP